MQPGKPDSSLIIQALQYDGVEMPPKKRLPQGVVQDFVTWVKMGAPDPRDAPSEEKVAVSTAKKNTTLWSLQPISVPRLPEAVSGMTGPGTRWDLFVLAKMTQAGLTPERDATPATLIRRITFDLLGLPPSAAETEAFVRDYQEDARKALEQLVDRLLGSSHYGERWGRHWLDVARYAESNGDDGLGRNPNFPHAWRYRDYVIESFNRDIPYDRFLKEQIAGDLLSAPNQEDRDRQLVATGFLALSAKPAVAMNDLNFPMDVVADQINLIGSGILGMSIGCARCHDHNTTPLVCATTRLWPVFPEAPRRFGEQQGWSLYRHPNPAS